MTSFDMIAMADELGESAPDELRSQIVGKKTLATMIDNLTAVKTLVSTLVSLGTDSGHIYMDLEGVNLSRHGSISLIQMLVPSCERPFIVDIFSLGVQAFETSSVEGKTLKDVFESHTIKKYLFDARNDADALYALFGFRLAGVVDIQLLELASRRGAKYNLCGLAVCIEKEQPTSLPVSSQWQRTKKEVVKMFDPKLGGSYKVFNERPLPQIFMEYCVGDVQFLPILSATYLGRLSRSWSEKARVETEIRLEESRSPAYKHRGKGKGLGPKSWRTRVGKTRMTPTTDIPVVSESATTLRSKVRGQPVVQVEGLQHQRKASMRGKVGKDPKGKTKCFPTSAYCKVPDFPENQNWALCDKDCGWCGYCGDGII